MEGDTNNERSFRTKLLTDIVEKLKSLEPLRGVSDALMSEEILEEMVFCRNEVLEPIEKLHSSPDRLKIPELAQRISYKADQVYQLLGDDCIGVKGHFYQIRNYPICKDLINFIFNEDTIGDIEKVVLMEKWPEADISVGEFYRYVSTKLLERDFEEECPIKLMNDYIMTYLRNSDKTDINTSDMKHWMDLATSVDIMSLYNYSEYIYTNITSIIDKMYDFERRRIEYIIKNFEGESSRSLYEINNELLDIANTFIKSVYIKAYLVYYVYGIVLEYCKIRTDLDLTLINDINESLIAYNMSK